jgi:hypothetical protein
MQDKPKSNRIGAAQQPLQPTPDASTTSNPSTGGTTMHDAANTAPACDSAPLAAPATGKSFAASPPSAPDPFDPASLRINNAAVPSLGVKKLLTTIPVKKPDKQAFIRVHPSEEYRLTAAIIDMKVNNEVYLVAPQLHGELAEEIAPVILFTYVDRLGNPFLWPVKLAQDDAAPNPWHASALAAAQTAMSFWVRVQANKGLGAYDVLCAEGNLPDPEWPDMTLAAMLKTAFRGRLIDTLDHPLIARLRGRA